MNNEKVSVLVPVYNRLKFLPRVIDCIFNQTYKNWQMIFAIDGGNDGSKEYLINIASRHNRVIVYYWEKNKGVGYARNKLLDVCDTRYALWQDSDDLCSYRRIEEQLKIMDNENKVVYSHWENLKKIKQVPGWLNEAIDYNNPSLGFAPTMFVVDETVRFDENMLWGGEDHKWLQEMTKKYPAVWCNKLLYYIDFHGDRIGSNKRRIDKNWGGKYNLEDIKDLSYEEALNKWKQENNG